MNKVIISPRAHAEIMYHVHKSSIEVSGLGRVQKLSDGTLFVDKIYLLKQENTSATTDIDQDAVAELLFQTREDKGSLTFWWHSHVNMGVFWSGTDMATIKQFGKQGYLLSTVFNKKGEHRTSYYQGGTDFLPEVFVDQIPTSFAYTPTEAEVKAWEAEHKEKCVKKVFKPTGFPKTGTYKTPGLIDDNWFDEIENDVVVNIDKCHYSGMHPLEVCDELLQLFSGSDWSELTDQEKMLWWDYYSLVNCYDAVMEGQVETMYNAYVEDSTAFYIEMDEIYEEIERDRTKKINADKQCVNRTTNKAITSTRHKGRGVKPTDKAKPKRTRRKVGKKSKSGVSKLRAGLR